MAITKEQWKEIESNLSHAHGCVQLKCDGYDVTLQVSLIDTLKYGVLVYVNGVSKGRWIIEDCEERRRFLRPVQSFLHKAKTRMDLIKIYGGKRAPKAEVERINAKFTYYCTYWTSVTALRRHLQKSNSDIEVVKIGYGA